LKVIRINNWLPDIGKATGILPAHCCYLLNFNILF